MENEYQVVRQATYKRTSTTVLWRNHVWFVVAIVVMAVLIAEAMVGFSNTRALDLGTGHTDKVERLQECLVPALELARPTGVSTRG